MSGAARIELFTGGMRTGIDLGQPLPELNNGNPIGHSLRAHRVHDSHGRSRGCHILKTA